MCLAEDRKVFIAQLWICPAFWNAPEQAQHALDPLCSAVPISSAKSFTYQLRDRHTHLPLYPSAHECVWTILAILLLYLGRKVGYRYEELRVNQDLHFCSPPMLCFQLSLAHTTNLNDLAQAPSPLWKIRLQVQCGLQNLPEKLVLEWVGLCWVSHCPFSAFRSTQETSLLLFFWSFAYNCHRPPTWISVSNWHKLMYFMNVMLSPFFPRC